MIAFHSVLPDIAQREVRCILLGPPPSGSPYSGLPAGEYVFIEFYCEDLNCDCRRVFLQVIAPEQPKQVLASINYGWESEAFYRQSIPWEPQAPLEIVQGSLDTLNTQSEHAADLLALFQQQVLNEPYRLRLQRHFQMCRDELRRRAEQTPPSTPTLTSRAQAGSLPSTAPERRIPDAHRARFAEVAALLVQFGQAHLDAELTGYTVELWSRFCRRRSPECLRGKPQVWAATVVHVIARINFLFDRTQPVHLTLDTICGFFQTNKTTVGSKATALERTLKLRSHSEPGLCRSDLMETFTTVQLANGMVLPFKMAQRMGYIPPGIEPADLS